MGGGSDHDLIVAAATDYVESWLDGDAARMASCLHPALAKRAVVDHDSGDLDLDEDSFTLMTTTAVEGGLKPLGRDLRVGVLDIANGIATAKAVSDPFVDLLHLARFGDRWLIVNALYERRPAADLPGEITVVQQSLDDYASSCFDRDVERARGVLHPGLVDRKVLVPAGDALDLDENTFEELLEVVAAGPEEPLERAWDAWVLDVSGDVASAKVTAAWWDIYPHLARFGRRWMIVNILTGRRTRRVNVPETRYAKTADGVHIAYQVVGDGPGRPRLRDGMDVPNIDAMWEEPILARFLTRLASFARLILFDKRGMGLSDRVSDDRLPSLEIADGRRPGRDGRGRLRAGGGVGRLGGRADDDRCSRPPTRSARGLIALGPVGRTPDARLSVAAPTGRGLGGRRSHEVRGATGGRRATSRTQALRMGGPEHRRRRATASIGSRPTCGAAAAPERRSRSTG